VLRLIISTQYQKLPKIVIDTMEFEFTVRRIAGRGYSKLFQQMSMEELIILALDVDRLKTIMPDYEKLFEDHDYIRNLLDMFIRLEIQMRREKVFLERGTVSSEFANESISERIDLHGFLNGLHKDDVQQLAINDNREV